MKYQFLLTALFLLATSSVVAADGRETQPTNEEIVTRMEQICHGVLTMKYQFLLTALFLLATSSVVAADGRETQPTTEEIVTRMAAHDLARQASIEGYAGMRRYVLENQKLHKRAEMLVQVQGDKDGTKHFDVGSEDGWKAAHKHVLHKMLESETETSRPEKRAGARLNSEN